MCMETIMTDKIYLYEIAQTSEYILLILIILSIENFLLC